MSENVIVNTVVNTSTSAKGFKEFSAQAERAATKAKAAVTTVQPAVEKTGGKVLSMGKQFAGAGAAISSANGALMLMGRQGPPAMQTLAAGAASVAVSGFGPMSLAIVAATTALSLFLSQSDDAAESMTSLDMALEKGTTRAEELRLELGRLGREIESLSTGQSFGSAERGFEFSNLRSEASQIRSTMDLLRQMQSAADPNAPDLNRFQRLRAQVQRTQSQSNFKSMGFSLGDDLFTGDVDTALGVLEKRQAQIAKTLSRLTEVGVREGVKKGLETATAGGKGVGLSSSSALGFAGRLGGRPGGFDTSGAGNLGLDFFGPLPTEDEVAARAMAANGIRSAAEIRAARQNALTRPPNLTADEAMGMFHSNPNQTATTGISALERDSQSRASAITANMASSFSSALLTQDYSGVGRAMAMSFVDATLNAIASGALQGLGVQDAAASGFSAIGSAFGAETGAEAAG